MKVGRWLLTRVAWLPALAAFVWAWFASRVPETAAAALARGDATPKWDFASSTQFAAEPMHVFARWTQLALLQVPGLTIRWTAFANALAALLLVAGLATLVRRTNALSTAAVAAGVGVLGLLAVSPAFGGDWLHGQRLGIVVVPLLLVIALRLLAHDRAPGWRALLAVTLAALAPFWHDHGVLVFAALVPAMFEATGRGEMPRRAGWLIALLLIGNLAAFASMFHVNVLALDQNGLFGRLTGDFSATAVALLRATGAGWLDPVPGLTTDDTVLGLLSWLAPLVLWRLGDRSPAARRAAAPWWSCLWFGLLLVAWNAERHGFPTDPVLARELAYGAFLLPIGVIGVAAARFGPALLPFGAGVLAVLAGRDWHGGLENLRLARSQAEQSELSIARAEPPSAELRPLVENGWMPSQQGLVATALREIGEVDPALGGFAGGDLREVRGHVRSSLRGDPVQEVIVQVRHPGGPFENAIEVQPAFAGAGRDVPWTAQFATPLPEGAKVRAIGIQVRKGTAVRLGPTFVVTGGKLVAEAGG